LTHVTAGGAFIASKGDSSSIQGDDMDSEEGVGSGVGDCMVICVDEKYGGLWGKGDISMESGQGEDGGSGGVIISSVQL
jgi:hypothetical protein